MNRETEHVVLHILCHIRHSFADARRIDLTSNVDQCASEAYASRPSKLKTLHKSPQIPLELENTITSKLSSDLINRILDCLHDDMPTLSACSLVSRSWLPRCRSHKFRSVDLGRALPLIPLLLKCPDISQLCQEC
ncbi:hypothetical protein A0H81_12550 [Grifola frondosa]|uniref:F-box domain-containing protein n=1 Tax=Grifola frondosa TaxID=5627 RepID=A0A1C7LRI1_GRIFR|nr:hypothetical protein A0H81_12550 [Grifola frondosa]